MLVFQKTLRTYLMDDPLSQITAVLGLIHLVRTQNFPKTPTCAYQGVKNVSFF